MPRMARRGAAAGAALGLAACDLSGIGGVGQITGGTLVAIEVGGDSVVAVGDTIRVGATGRIDGIAGIFGYDRLLDATWRSSDPTVASVAVRLPPAGDSTTSTRAVVRGLRAGTVQVRAAARGKSGERTVTVIDPAPR